MLDATPCKQDGLCKQGMARNALALLLRIATSVFGEPQCGRK